MAFNASIKRLVVMLLCYYIMPCAAQQTLQSFSKLYTLNGTWSMELKNGKLCESWQKIDDSTLRGKSFKITTGDTTILEQVDLVLRNQKLLYVAIAAHQNNNQPVTFTLISLSDNKYIFENLLHDFPQRVIYELPVGNTLHAWIEGNTPSGIKKSDYNYKRE